MPKATVIQANIWRVIKSEAKPKWITWDDQPITIEIDFDRDLYKKLDEDPLLQAKLWEAASGAYKDFVKASKKSFTQADKDLGRLYSAKTGPDLKSLGSQLDAVKKRLVKEMASHESALKKDVPKAVDSAWNKIKSKNKEYRNYKIKSVVSVTLRFGVMIFAAVGLFSNPFTAGPGILAIQTLVSGTVSTLQDCVKLAQSAGTLRASTEKLMVTLDKRYASGVKKANLTDFALANFKTVFGLDVSHINTAVKNVKQYRKKLIGVDKSSHKSAKDLQKALKDMDKVRKNSPDFFQGQMANEFKDLENTINVLITTVVDLQTGVKDGNRWADDQEKVLKVLSSKKPYALSALEKILSLGLSAAKVGIDYADMEKFAADGVKQAGNAAKILNGVYHEAQKYEKERKAIAKKLKG